MSSSLPSPPDWSVTARAIGELRAKAASARDAAHFSHLPWRAGPFRLRHMLPRDAVLLYAVANPVFGGRPARRCRPSELLAFLIVVANPGARTAGWGRRLWLTVRLLVLLRRRAALQRFCTQLDAYIFETFVDCPASSGAAGTGRDSGAGLRTSFLSSIIHSLAAEYHWSRAEIYATPLRELMLYRKHIVADWKREARQTVDDISPEEYTLRDDYLRATEAWQKQAARKPENN